MISGQKSKSQPTLSIIGAGALGCNIYLQCAKALPSRLIGQTRGRRQVGEQNIAVTPWSQVQAIDVAIICTKVNHLAGVCQALQSRLHDQSITISLSNGMGYDHLLSALPGHYLPGVTTAAAWRQEDEVVVVANGDTSIGGGHAPQWLSLLPWQWQSNMSQARWQKLVINALINPLTILADAANGQLCQPPWQTQQATLAQEIDQLSLALGYQCPPAFASAQKVCQATADNLSSSLQDVRAKRPTELPWICGFLMAQADQAGHSMPHYRALCQTLEQHGHATQLV